MISRYPIRSEKQLKNFWMARMKHDFYFVALFFKTFENNYAPGTLDMLQTSAENPKIYWREWGRDNILRDNYDFNSFPCFQNVQLSSSRVVVLYRRPNPINHQAVNFLMSSESFHTCIGEYVVERVRIKNLVGCLEPSRPILYTITDLECVIVLLLYVHLFSSLHNLCCSKKIFQSIILARVRA